MASVSEVREKLGELLADQISLDQFEDWFLPYSWNIHKRANHEVQRLVYAIEHTLSEFDEDSTALRRELANAAIPFVVYPHRISWVRHDGIPVPMEARASAKVRKARVRKLVREGAKTFYAASASQHWQVCAQAV